jgi:hypothetical protein
LYNRDVLGGLWSQFLMQASDIPEPPEAGTYNIGDVLEADYFVG